MKTIKTTYQCMHVGINPAGEKWRCQWRVDCSPKDIDRIHRGGKVYCWLHTISKAEP